MTLLPLSAEELLMTTRGVRKRLDFSRPVERDVLRACVAAALQAPSGSNRWALQFVIVTDPERRRGCAGSGPAGRRSACSRKRRPPRRWGSAPRK